MCHPLAMTPPNARAALLRVDVERLRVELAAERDDVGFVDRNRPDLHGQARRVVLEVARVEVTREGLMARKGHGHAGGRAWRTERRVVAPAARMPCEIYRKRWRRSRSAAARTVGTAIQPSPMRAESDDLEVALQLPVGHRVLPLAPFPLSRRGEVIDEEIAEPVACDGRNAGRSRSSPSASAARAGCRRSPGWCR